MLLKYPVKSIILHICTVRKCATTLRFEQDMFPGDHHQLLAVIVVDLDLIWYYNDVMYLNQCQASGERGGGGGGVGEAGLRVGI